MSGFWQLHSQWELNPEPWGLYCITIPHGQKNFIRKYMLVLPYLNKYKYTMAKNVLYSTDGKILQPGVKMRCGQVAENVL